MDGAGRGEVRVVGAAGCPAFEVARQPADNVGVERGGGYVGDELGVMDCIKGFGEIYGHGYCAGWGALLVETSDYCVGEGQEC